MSPLSQSMALKVSMPEVLTAVKSLYADDLKPYGRIILRRLRERAASAVALEQGLDANAVDVESMPKIDPKRLRRTCEKCPHLRVIPEEGREFSVILAGHACHFLDVSSPNDPYPPQMWMDAAAYFQNLSGDDMRMPGGRYACACELARRGLPFLVGCSLGQVCHIIQLAISQKRILGYMEGSLVPYMHSEDWIKEQHAFHQQPISSKANTQLLPVATLEEVRAHLRGLLSEDGVVTLSNVKRLFRSRCGLELSETVLGHSRLFDLLHDVRFRDVCTIQAQKNGQLMVKPVGSRQTPCQLVAFPPVASLEPAFPASTPELWSTIDMGSISYPVTAAQMSAMPPNLAMLRSVRVDMGMESQWHGLSTGGSRSAIPSKFCSEELDESTDVPSLRDSSGSSGDETELRSPLSSLGEQAEFIRLEEEQSVAMLASTTAVIEQTPNVAPLRFQEREHMVKNTFIDIPSAADVGARRRRSSVPKSLGSRWSA